MLKSSKAITIVALSITVSVLLVLAGISVKVMNDNGLIGNAKQAKENYEEAEQAEIQRENEIVNSKYSKHVKVENTTAFEIQESEELLLKNYRIYGNSVQDTVTNGNPSPGNPVEIQSVGDLVPVGEHAGEYKIPVISTGKNLFDMKKVTHNGVQEQNKISATSGTTNVDYFLKAGTYSLAFEKDFEGAVFFRKGQVTSGYFSSDKDLNCFVKFTFEEDQYLRMTFFSNPGTISDIMLVEGIYTEDTIPAYEPYNGITTNIYLDEPLRSVGEVTDYIDFKEQKLVRNINMINLSDYEWREQTHETNPFYYIFGVSPKPLTSQHSNARCNIFTGIDIGTGYGNIGIHPFVSGIIRARPDLTEYDTLDKWKEYISSNKPYIQYVIATKETSIKLPDIPLHQGYNNIMVNTTIAPSKIEVNY